MVLLTWRGPRRLLRSESSYWTADNGRVFRQQPNVWSETAAAHHVVIGVDCDKGNAESPHDDGMAHWPSVSINVPCAVEFCGPSFLTSKRSFADRTRHGDIL